MGRTDSNPIRNAPGHPPVVRHDQAHQGCPACLCAGQDASATRWVSADCAAESDAARFAMHCS